jgi:hypothetical protein
MSSQAASGIQYKWRENQSPQSPRKPEISAKPPRIPKSNILYRRKTSLQPKRKRMSYKAEVGFQKRKGSSVRPRNR